MYEDGQVRDSMRIIVGKPNRTDQTPLIASTISYATFKPYWHVPPSLVRKLTASNVLRKGFGYLRSRGYQVVSGYTADPQIIPPQSVDWKAVAAGREEARVRQLPGPANSMGDMKFSFPNSSAIYLHDTPLKSLFDKPQRTLSAGCIRLEDAPRFVRWLLRGEPQPSGEPEQHVQLPAGVPIYVTYLTARVEGDQLTFVDDVYGLDAQLASEAGAGE
jgi:murein L,D-transpeptidase YcbB/YkuD